MKNLYDNLDEAVAFAISFNTFIYIYNDMCPNDFLEYCPICGDHKQSRDYLCIPGMCKVETGIIMPGAYFVSTSLRNELIARFDITEDDFRPVKSKRDAILGYQIYPKHVLPPLAEVNGWWEVSDCPICGKNCEYEPIYNDKDEEYYYITKEILDEMHDFNVTYERIYKDPMPIISRRVYDFLIERCPRTHYVPFFLKDSK